MLHVWRPSRAAMPRGRQVCLGARGWPCGVADIMRGGSRARHRSSMLEQRGHRRGGTTLADWDLGHDLVVLFKRSLEFGEEGTSRRRGTASSSSNGGRSARRVVSVAVVWSPQSDRNAARVSLRRNYSCSDRKTHGRESQRAGSRSEESARVSLSPGRFWDDVLARYSMLFYK
jgi:hypothetical protein